jgi:hypothetical protein
MLDWELYEEADRRGLLKGERKELYEEAKRRGLAGKTAAPAQPEQPKMTAGEFAGDLAKSAGIGLVQGAIGLGTLPGNIEALGRAGINYGAGLLGVEPPVSPDTALINYNDFKGRAEQKFGEFYKPQSTAGEYVRTIGEFAPALLTGGAAAGSSMAARAGSRAAQVAVPAVASETAGQLTEGTAFEPIARVAGAIAGTRAPNLAARTVTPAPADPARQAAVNTLRNEGVTSLTAGQTTGNNRLRWVEDATSMVPGGGGRATAMQGQAAEQYTRAALKRAGIQADRATPDVIDNAFRSIGQEFDQFAQTINVRATPTFANRLTQLADRYESVTPPVTRVPAVREAAANIAAKVASPQGMSGAEFATYRSELRRLQRGMKDNPQASESVGRIIETLDAQMVRSAPRGQRAKYANTLQDLNKRYRNMLAIEDAAGAAGENAALGLISPAALKQAVKRQNKKDYTRGRSELGQLAKAGEGVLRPLPSSGTAERSFAQGVVSAPGSVVGYAAGGDPISAMIGTVAPAAIRAGVARGVMSTPMQNYFANQRIPQAIEPIDPRQFYPLLPFMGTRQD